MNIAISAQLAQAAYANLSGGMASPVLADALQAPQGAFTLTQATQFASNQTVLLQYNDDAAVPGATGSSLSLTVFQGNDGKLTLAIRGTLESGDFAPTDSMLAAQGAGYDQIAALYNWWQRVSAPAGTQVAQYRVRTMDLADPTPTASLLPLYALPSMGSNQAVVLERIADVSATGALIPALATDGDNRLDVTGHSLGGGLASVMAVWFDRPAYVFAAAPFQSSADANQPTNTVAAYALQSVMQIMRSRLDNVDPSFASYDPATDFASREANAPA